PYASRRHPPSFPRRRSSDLALFPQNFSLFIRKSSPTRYRQHNIPCFQLQGSKHPNIFPCTFDTTIDDQITFFFCLHLDLMLYTLDRKSTRLNSSHVKISYAV